MTQPARSRKMLSQQDTADRRKYRAEVLARLLAAHQALEDYAHAIGKDPNDVPHTIQLATFEATLAGLNLAIEELHTARMVRVALEEPPPSAKDAYLQAAAKAEGTQPAQPARRPTPGEALREAGLTMAEATEGAKRAASAMQDGIPAFRDMVREIERTAHTGVEEVCACCDPPVALRDHTHKPVKAVHPEPEHENDASKPDEAVAKDNRLAIYRDAVGRERTITLGHDLRCEVIVQGETWAAKEILREAGLSFNREKGDKAAWVGRATVEALGLIGKLDDGRKIRVQVLDGVLGQPGGKESDERTQMVIEKSREHAASRPDKDFY